MERVLCRAGRLVGGHEAVTVTVQSPSGVNQVGEGALKI